MGKWQPANLRLAAPRILAVLALTLALPVSAQDQDAAEIAGLVRSAPLPDAGLIVDPAVRADAGCGSAGSGNQFAASVLHCPFAATSIGLNFGQRIDLPDGVLAMRMGFGRGNDASLSLDRQLLQRSGALLRESSLMAIGGDATLFDRRLKISSDMGWSSSWETALSPNRGPNRKGYQLEGFAQRHAFEFQAIDRKGLRWKIDGWLSRSSEDFRTGTIAGIGNLLMGMGDMDRIGTRFDVGNLSLRLSLLENRTNISRNRSTLVSAGYGGITLSLRNQRGSTMPQPGLSVGTAQSTGSSLALDFDIFTLAPMVALQGKGLASLLPTQFTLTLDDRTVQRPASALRPLTRRRGADLFGTWKTALGDTTIDYGWDSLINPLGNRLERNRQLMVSHSVRLGGWSLYANLLSLRTKAIGGDDDSTLYYSAALSRTFANGTRVRIEIGRDTQSLGGVASDFTLRDKSHRAKVELDLSAPLQSRLQNNSVHFSLAAQVRLNRSGYQLRFLDELLDEGTEGYSRQGILASFGYSF